MKNIQILIEALEFIEQNLTESIKTEDIAEHLYCSKSTVEKLFKYINNISIRDYIIRIPSEIDNYTVKGIGKSAFGKLDEGFAPNIENNE